MTLHAKPAIIAADIVLSVGRETRIGSGCPTGGSSAFSCSGPSSRSRAGELDRDRVVSHT